MYCNASHSVLSIIRNTLWDCTFCTTSKRLIIQSKLRSALAEIHRVVLFGQPDFTLWLFASCALPRMPSCGRIGLCAARGSFPGAFFWARLQREQMRQKQTLPGVHGGLSGPAAPRSHDSIDRVPRPGEPLSVRFASPVMVAPEHPASNLSKRRYLHATVQVARL
jgi:hypothetical protein